ncbi:MAG: hypothetical protein ABI821_16215 [Pseudomonadota bacterium]
MNTTRITAIHEAAHAVAALRCGLVFDNVTAVPDEEFELDGALNWMALHDEVGLEMSIEALAMVSLAGPCAEAKLRRLRPDRVFAGVAALDDRESVAQLGLSETQFVTASRDALDLVERDWPIIERIADALEAGGTLSYDEVEALMPAEAE